MRKTLVLTVALMLFVTACSEGADETTTTTAAGGGETTTTAAGDDSTTTTAGETPAEPVRDDIVISLEGEPPTLDVSTTSSTFTVSVLMWNVLETLVRLDPETGELLPGLASSWETSEDGLVHTFSLRDGATFSTGEPVLASDVTFSYERMSMEGSPHAPSFAAMESVEAIDDSTVQVTLARRSNNWLQSMAKRPGMIFAEANFDQLAENPIGSGPFKLDTWTRGDSITLTHNEHFDGEPPALTEAVFTFITDNNAVINGLQAGDVHVIANLTARDRAPELESSGYVVSPDPTPRVHGFFFRVDAELTDELLVRQAISHAIDKQGLVDALSGGYGVPVGAWVTTGDPWYEDFELYPYDPDRTRELLAEAGYPDGIDIELSVISENISGEQGEIVALMLEDAGIRTDLKVMELAAFLDEVLGQGRHQTAIVASVTGINRFANGTGWFTGWNDETFNQMIADADAAPTTEEQYELLSEATRYFAENAPMVAMYNDVNLTIEAPGIQNWIRNRVDQGFDLYGVSWAE